MLEERLIEIIRLALRYKATDIHFNERYKEVKIEMRIDGDLKKVKSKYDDYKLIRYLKYLANIDVQRKLIPQTSSFEMIIDNKTIKLRYAIIDNESFSDSVLRILEV